MKDSSGFGTGGEGYTVKVEVWQELILNFYDEEKRKLALI
jgi:hypothetical protein